MGSSSTRYCLPFCPHCGKETLATDSFCFGCGQSQERAAVGTVSTPPQELPVVSQQGSKSPIASAVLNFLPGIGDIHNGIGHNTGELVFGVLVFIFFFLGLGAGVVAEALTSHPAASTTQTSPYEALIFLVYLLPFAFAYDGYRRAKYD